MGKPADISGYLVNRFKAEYRNANWRFDCPLCGADKKRFSVSLTKGVCHCWKCNYTKSLLGFVCDVESVTLAESFRIVQKYGSVRTPRVPKVHLPLPESKQDIPGYVRLGDVSQSDVLGRLAKSYLKKRGLNEEDTRYWELGISTRDEYTGYIISPIREFGRLRYFVSRKFIGPGTKYRNPPLSEWGLGASELVFNLDSAVRECGGVTIVEGVYDVYATGRRAAALLGKHASDMQISKIIMANPKSIEIMLDADAKDDAFELASRFEGIVPVTVTILKSGDPGDRTSTVQGKVRYSFRTLVQNKLGRTKW